MSDPRDEIINELTARLEQSLPFLYKLSADRPNTAKPVEMMIAQVETALANANKARKP